MPTTVELPLLPASLQHLRACGMSLRGVALGRPAALQTLVCRRGYPGTLFPTLRALRALTALVLSKSQPNAPVSLSVLTALTSLRYLDASHHQGPGEGAAILAQLRHLPRLEWLRLENCRLAELPWSMPAPLRGLDVANNPAAIPADAPWLATLEQLGCSLCQVRACCT